MATELLYRDDAYLKTATARVVAARPGLVELDRTIFYAQGGGQPGDTGYMVRESGERLSILDTRKGEAQGNVNHILAPGAAPPAPGEQLSLELDWPRRYALMRLHTALHVMSCVVVAPVTGGNISPDKARLDFDIDMTLLDAQPELVKTMSVQPPRGTGRIRLLRIPGIDLQPCGGTHVRDISEIGGIRVLRIRNEGKRNKRVEIALVEAPRA
ncbi:MAG: alanyl-tRNA editing protein [Steroidobacteraceae bacterium]